MITIFRKVRRLLSSGIYQQIPETEILERQRYKLFFVFSIALFLICLAESIHAISFNTGKQFLGPGLQFFSIIAVANYIALQIHKNLRAAYFIAILTAFACVHLFNYYYGGIRNSGNFYYLVMIITTFMLLGNREGKWMLVLASINQVYFYFVSSNPAIVTNVLSGNESDLNQDFLFSTVMAVLAIAALSNSLGSSKNIVIEKITTSRNNLARQNIELNKLSLVASKTDSAVIITDTDFKTEWANDAFMKITGYDPIEVKGKRIDEVLFGTQTDFAVVQQMHNQLMTLHPFTGELQQYKKDRSTFWALVSVTPVKNDAGFVNRYVIIQDNITERIEAEKKIKAYLKELEKTNKELDEFAYVVSHDLKAPLHAISNLTGWIEEDMKGSFSDDTSDNFNIIKNRVARMEDLINGLLEYARANAIKSEKSLIDLNTEVADIANFLAIPENCTISIAGTLPTLYGDRIKFQQIFANLVGNAIKYNDKKEIHIAISAEETSDEWQIKVRDNGPGIDPRFHEKIFVIFQTLNPRDSVESTGVGLAIVKKIIEEAGGTIQVASAPGNGCTFLFTWPKNEKSVFNQKTPSIALFH
ncbi:MAG TPA: ATP-binding protein [Bacteroidia bacterium]|nr:ATP-binding protein [Bacteroidia bacterium]